MANKLISIAQLEAEFEEIRRRVKEEESTRMTKEDAVRQQQLAAFSSINQAAFAATENAHKSADDAQVGGSHYKDMPIQPWDVIEANGYDFWEGSALSYIMRWRVKGGVTDLQKAIHYLQKIIEMEQKKGLETPL